MAHSHLWSHICSLLLISYSSITNVFLFLFWDVYFCCLSLFFHRTPFFLTVYILHAVYLTKTAPSNPWLCFSNCHLFPINFLCFWGIYLEARKINVQFIEMESERDVRKKKNAGIHERKLREQERRGLSMGWERLWVQRWMKETGGIEWRAVNSTLRKFEKENKPG